MYLKTFSSLFKRSHSHIQVQAIFCALKESKHQYYTPEGFWEAFKYWGEPVNLREQHDSLEFFSALLDNLVRDSCAQLIINLSKIHLKVRYSFAKLII